MNLAMSISMNALIILIGIRYAAIITTAAVDGNVFGMYLPEGIFVYVTFLGTYYPDYTPTQRIGIIPDYEVRPTIQGIRDNRDEVLEFALNCEWVGINEVSENDEISVYPNPTNGELKITSGQLTIKNVEIFDVTGRKIQGSKFKVSCSNPEPDPGLNSELNFKPETVIDISHLPSGVYFIQIQTENGMITRKVVKN